MSIFTKPTPPVEPSIEPKVFGLAIIEQTLARLSKQVSQEHQGTVFIMKDLAAVRDRLNIMSDYLRQQTDIYVAELTGAASQLQVMLDSLEGRRPAEETTQAEGTVAASESDTKGTENEKV